MEQPDRPLRSEAAGQPFRSSPTSRRCSPARPSHLQRSVGQADRYQSQCRAACCRQVPTRKPYRARDQQADKLRAFHELGTLLRIHVPDRVGYGAKQFVELAEAIGHQPGWLYKVSRFAVTYNKSELDALCRTSLSWGHVAVLMPLDKTERLNYQRTAAKRRWTVEDLRRAIRSKHPPRRPGGRQIAVASNPADALRQLVGDGQIRLRRSKAVQGKCGASAHVRP